MDDSVSVAVGGIFLLTGAASGVNVTRGAVTLLLVDALSVVNAANRSLATLTVSTNRVPPQRPFPVATVPTQLTV